MLRLAVRFSPAVGAARAASEIVPTSVSAEAVHSPLPQPIEQNNCLEEGTPRLQDFKPSFPTADEVSDSMNGLLEVTKRSVLSMMSEETLFDGNSQTALINAVQRCNEGGRHVLKSAAAKFANSSEFRDVISTVVQDPRVLLSVQQNPAVQKYLQMCLPQPEDAEAVACAATTSTSKQQYEGAADDDKKRQSIWEKLFHSFEQHWMSLLNSFTGMVQSVFGTNPKAASETTVNVDKFSLTLEIVVISVLVIAGVFLHRTKSMA